MSKANYYVTNKELLKELEKYKETNVLTEELGRMVLAIAQNYSNKGSFVGYTWKDDMIQEAVYTVLKYVHNFDPSKQKKPNPFAYITTICHRAFVNYINKQKKHSKIKDECYKKVHKIFEEESWSIKGINYKLLKDD